MDNALPGEYDVPSFFGDVDPHELGHDRLELWVSHVPALLRVKDLLADQGADP
jgi:hypothetical protein